MFELGDVVFFKQARRWLTKSAKPVTFKGYAYGVLLGSVGPCELPPQASHLMRLMGNAGFVALDDIIDLMGADFANELVAKFEKKYYGMTSDESKIPGAPEIVEMVVPGVDSKPLYKGITEKRLEPPCPNEN